MFTWQLHPGFNPFDLGQAQEVDNKISYINRTYCRDVFALNVNTTRKFLQNYIIFNQGNYENDIPTYFLIIENKLKLKE